MWLGIKVAAQILQWWLRSQSRLSRMMAAM